MKGMPNKEQACCTKCAIFGRNNEPPHAYDVPAGCSHIHCSCHKSSCGGTTHFVCAEKLAEDGGKAVCCGCTGHECLSLPEQKDKNGHKIGADGKLVFDALCEGCDAPEQEGWEERFDENTEKRDEWVSEGNYYDRPHWFSIKEFVRTEKQYSVAETDAKWQQKTALGLTYEAIMRASKMASADQRKMWEEGIRAEERERVKDLLESKIIYKEDIELPIKGQTERLIRGLAKNELIQDLLSALSNTDK